ncbi:PEP/pyruvate-binding domain-containing protein, partial [Arthrospira platensis SPKY1]|nr:PEP/pyruvate-binding domain-containing protein [Arthrospira platensis SPKY1]
MLAGERIFSRDLPERDPDAGPAGSARGFCVSAMFVYSQPVIEGRAMTKKYIYKYTEGDGKNKMLLGGKGANLCEMTQIGLRVPPGFVITTEACLDYIASNRLPEGLMESVREHMAWLERETG